MTEFCTTLTLKIIWNCQLFTASKARYRNIWHDVSASFVSGVCIMNTSCIGDLLCIIVLLVLFSAVAKRIVAFSHCTLFWIYSIVLSNLQTRRTVVVLQFLTLRGIAFGSKVIQQRATAVLCWREAFDHSYNARIIFNCHDNLVWNYFGIRTVNQKFQPFLEQYTLTCSHSSFAQISHLCNIKRTNIRPP